MSGSRPTGNVHLFDRRSDGMLRPSGAIEMEGEIEDALESRSNER